MPTTSTELKIAVLRMDGATQPRAELDVGVIDEYAADLENGAAFPPVCVFLDGKDYWLADGFHRVKAYEKRGKRKIQAEVHQGSQRDVILFSVGANAEHGQRRTNADKRRAVQTLLEDEEWEKWSNREIAKRAGVSEFLVRDMRPPGCDSIADAPRQATRNGTTYEMNTANIGAPQKVDVVITTPAETPPTFISPTITTAPAEAVAPTPRKPRQWGGISPKAARPGKRLHLAPRLTITIPSDDPSGAVVVLRHHFQDSFLRRVAEEILKTTDGKDET